MMHFILSIMESAAMLQRPCALEYCFMESGRIIAISTPHIKKDVLYINDF